METDKNQNKMMGRIIASILIAFLTVLITHIKLGIGYYGLMDMMGSTWAYLALLAAIFLASFVAMFSLIRSSPKIKIEISDEEKKKRREGRIDIILLAVDLLMTGTFVKLNWEQLNAAGLFLAVAQVAAFFAIVWMIFQFFNRFKFFPERIFKFVFDFIVTVCIPMLFLLVILLGAYQAKYGYDDIFRSQISANADKFANVMRDAYEKLITAFYDIGQSNPNLWIWLPIAAFFVMTLILLYTTFTRPIKKEEDKSAQEIINEAIKEDIEENEYETGKKQRSPAQRFFKRINDFMKSKKEKEKEEQEKIAEKNAVYNIYDITLTKMKGGKG
jgi:hypothetical protein